MISLNAKIFTHFCPVAGHVLMRYPDAIRTFAVNFDPLASFILLPSKNISFSASRYRLLWIFNLYLPFRRSFSFLLIASPLNLTTNPPCFTFSSMNITSPAPGICDFFMVTLLGLLHAYLHGVFVFLLPIVLVALVLLRIPDLVLIVVGTVL